MERKNVQIHAAVFLYQGPLYIFLSFPLALFQTFLYLIVLIVCLLK